jgi:DNA-binding CsgD family transcriptional regulator
MEEAVLWKPAPCCCQAEHLTDREIDVLCQLAAGLTNDQAASAMSVSGHTVAGHLRSMLARATARNRAELVARAYAAGVLTANSWPPRWSGRRCMIMPVISAASELPRLRGDDVGQVA